MNKTINMKRFNKVIKSLKSNEVIRSNKVLSEELNKLILYEDDLKDFIKNLVWVDFKFKKGNYEIHFLNGRKEVELRFNSMNMKLDNLLPYIQEELT